MLGHVERKEGSIVPRFVPVPLLEALVARRWPVPAASTTLVHAPHHAVLIHVLDGEVEGDIGGIGPVEQPRGSAVVLHERQAVEGVVDHELAVVAVIAPPEIVDKRLFDDGRIGQADARPFAGALEARFELPDPGLAPVDPFISRQAAADPGTPPRNRWGP